jgi:hypothetical protein
VTFLLNPSQTFRLVVCGGRDYTDHAHVFATLDRVHAKRPVSVLIHGAARGADTLAAEWAAGLALEVWAFPARWDQDGRKAAGPKRNQLMLDTAQPHGCVAFPGGSGTADMVRRAEAAGVTVMRVKPVVYAVPSDAEMEKMVPGCGWEA